MTIGDAVAEVRRELMIRAAVYPKLVDQGKLTQGEADRRMQALRYAQAILESRALVMHAVGSQPTEGGHDLAHLHD